MQMTQVYRCKHKPLFYFLSVQSQAAAADRNPSTEQPDGAVVPHALPYAPRLPVPPRVQRMVF